MLYNIKQRAFFVQKYHQNPSVVGVQRAYKLHFKTKKCPSRKAILHHVVKFHETGSVVHIPPKKLQTSEKRKTATASNQC